MSHIQRIKVYRGKAVNVWSDKPTEIVPGVFLSTLRTKDNEQLCRELNIFARIAIYRRGDTIPWAIRPRDGCQQHFPSICRFINHHADAPSLEDFVSKKDANNVKTTTRHAEGGECRQTSHGPRAVLVHCVMGVSRSSTAVAAFLMHKYGMSRNLALNYISERRPQICPRENFRAQLLRWQEDRKHQDWDQVEPDPLEECSEDEPRRIRE
ncbi:hypothetical protein MAPG_04563 [Magnaporthiopsis poae ATCC 64411]|uniref:protein-tyrosine-phosphatase n=1 Tax=Magnaporthiopsis poae (strain ATCC 64411 / 73-15) TaxID=644358 RepID=A0A0C4DX25_MAGP6|nr:hypothetical protein MAPG_04563 [Magnaporthiopsis poae ATCC 64411]